MKLTTAQLDRACGVLLATAAGDALGAPYEFQPPRGPELSVDMVGGGSFGWAPGEWTDDTSMAVAIAEVAASGADLRSENAQDRILTRWVGWAHQAKDVGIQTRSVLSAAHSAATSRAVAAALHESTGRSGGNGSLMRTAPVALAYLDDEDALIEAASSLGTLTHFDPEAGEACLLWCLAIRHAVLTGTLMCASGSNTSMPHAAACGRSASTTPRRRGRPASRTTAGWSRRSRAPGRRSRLPKFPRTTRLPACSAPTTCERRSRPRCAVGATRTPSPPSPAACWAPPTVRPPCRPSGGGCCTAGPDCVRAN